MIELFGQSAPIAGIFGLLAILFWRIFLAYLVMNDADRLFKANRLFLNSNLAWILATLIVGVLAVFAYWLIHYSTLAAGPKQKG